MTLNQRKALFVRLGELFSHLALAPEARVAVPAGLQVQLDAFDALIVRERAHNGWFTEANVRQALGAWAAQLTDSALTAWLAPYDLPAVQAAPKRVGIIMAGNIPLVGFHDFLSVVLVGHHALIKLSRDDNRLLPEVLATLVGWDAAFSAYFTLVLHKLEHAEALIATGSNNTARYFEYYFAHIPRIIRKNRTSVAVLDGSETEAELIALGRDIFDYFGLGCRNVTKLFLPADFDLDRVFAGLYPYRDIGNHNKYANNYDYHKALWLLNREQLLENGFILVKEDAALVSPVGSLFIERYTDAATLKNYLLTRADVIQCVVGHGFVPFGGSQFPQLTDYADGVDTVGFLVGLGGTGG